MGEEVKKEIISTPPEIVTSTRRISRNSTGQANKETPASPIVAEKSLPHYLRASTNSCHDFCKYGIKHEFTPEEKQLFRRKVTQYGRSSIDYHVEAIDVQGRKKKPLTKLKAPEVKVEHVGKPKVLFKQRSFKSVKKIEISVEPSIASKKKHVEEKSPSPSNLDGLPSGISSQENASSNTLGRINVRKSSQSISSDCPSINGSNKSSGKGGRNGQCHSSSLPKVQRASRRNSEKGTVQKTLPIGEKKVLKPPVASSFPKASIKCLPTLKSKSYQSTKVVPSMMEGDCSGKEPPVAEQVEERTIYVIDPKPAEPNNENPSEHDETTMPLSFSSPISCPSLPSDNGEEAKSKPGRHTVGEAINSKIKTMKKETEASKGADKRKTWRSTMIFTDPVEGTANYKTTKKRIDASKGKDERKLWRSTMVCTESVEWVVNDKAATKGIEASKGGDTPKLRSTMICTKGIDTPPEKQRFQRGKVVSLERQRSVPRMLKFRPGRVVGESKGETENAGPKRLKFRQGRVLGISLARSLTLRRSFKRNLDGADTSTRGRIPTILLKHQHIQGKKEEQGLYNEVIEETANKLVVTRKSKVKALVGAFETVISLQESKPVVSD